MRRQELQDATGVALHNPPDGVLQVYQRVGPTNGQAGFAVGCIWVNMAGTIGGILYVNTGTKTSSTWTNVT
jgi:hypothetical protein